MCGLAFLAATAPSSAPAPTSKLSPQEKRIWAQAEGGFGGFVTLERTKPVIAAVEGPAVAGGCELVPACDLVVASPNALWASRG